MIQENSTISSPALTAQEELAAAPISGIPQEIALLELLTELARRKALIAKVTIAAVAIGIALSLVLPVRYMATTKIMPPQETQSTASLLMNQLAGSGAAPLAVLAGGGLGLKSPNDLYVGLLQSRPIADALIHQFDLVSVYRARDMTAAREKLKKHTEVVSEKSGLIAISVTDRDKKRAAALANAYASELRVLTQNLAVTEASRRRLFYEEQLKQAKEALVAAELALQQVQLQKGVVQLDAQAKAMIEGLAALRAQVAAKQVEVQALRSYSTEHNPDVQLAEQELDTMQAEVARLEQSSHSPEFANLGLKNMPSAGLEYLRAQHELLYQQALYDMLMKQYDAAKLDEAKEAAVIQVAEPAIEPDRKSSPKRVLIVVLSMVAGFFAGCCTALFLWWKEVLRLDPVSARQLDELVFALHRRKAPSA
jgi:uncharacterized protein involved in exopolysaccharide biosynthesis